MLQCISPFLRIVARVPDIAGKLNFSVRRDYKSFPGGGDQIKKLWVLLLVRGWGEEARASLQLLLSMIYLKRLST